MPNLQTIKMIAGATIVITAICIMLPGVMGYAFSLARLATIIIIAVVVSSALALAAQFLIKRNKRPVTLGKDVNVSLVERATPQKEVQGE
ncbi:MAG: hypothetical protein K2X77_08790 [Candidatus Obscuribacterales bacterium]|nr:hypothetical protein [Candidatus Obscuribacterales bacterium]